MEETDHQGDVDDGLSWMALLVTFVVLAVIVGLVLFFKLNLFEGGTSPLAPTT